MKIRVQTKGHGRISFRELVGFIDGRIDHFRKIRTEIVTNLNSCGIRGPIGSFPPGGKKSMRHNMHTRISELDGHIQELEWQKEHFIKRSEKNA